MSRISSIAGRRGDREFSRVCRCGGDDDCRRVDNKNRSTNPRHVLSHAPSLTNINPSYISQTAQRRHSPAQREKETYFLVCRGRGRRGSIIRPRQGTPSCPPRLCEALSNDRHSHREHGGVDHAGPPWVRGKRGREKLEKMSWGSTSSSSSSSRSSSSSSGSSALFAVMWGNRIIAPYRQAGAFEWQGGTGGREEECSRLVARERRRAKTRVRMRGQTHALLTSLHTPHSYHQHRSRFPPTE